MAFRKKTAGSNKRLRYIIVVAVLFIGIYLSFDYTGPGTIKLRSETAFGLDCLRARDLIVQEYDTSGNLWATRGMIIYRLNKDEERFMKVAHIPTGFSIYWIRNFSLVRRLTLRPECVEMVLAGNGDYYAISAGRLWHMSSEGGKFKEVFTLPHYGLGDQGIRNDGMLSFNETSLYLGEYFTNPSRDTVKVFNYKKDTKKCQVAYSFLPGQIRHVHAIQKDPFTGKIWICTGDSDEESMIAWSDDGLKTVNSIVSGSQLARVCQLVFTDNAVFWGTDAGTEDVAGIYKWDRVTGEVTNLKKIDGAVFYATSLQGGTMVFSSDREGLSNEKDDRTRLYIVSEGNAIKVIDCGTWNHNKPGFFFKYALLRIQRNQNGHSLAITCLNQKEFPDGDLIIIAENALR